MWVCVCCLVLLGLARTPAGYNVDTELPLVFSGPRGALFGYSVLLHRYRQQTWLLVGAPVANSTSRPLIRSPGAVYRCPFTATQSRGCEQIPIDLQKCGRTCEPESDDQWLGVSLSGQPSNGQIVVCGHRWKNVFYSRTDSQNNKLPHGVCYHYERDLQQAKPIIPCYRAHQRKFGEDYGSCQAGISNFLTEDLVVMGAPGTAYWTGSVLVYNTSSKAMSAYLDEDDNVVQFGSYLGYSVGAGHFLHPDTTEVVGGAPQHSQKGKAFVFRVEANRLIIVSKVSGNKLGSYFGASVCAVDLNGDGLSDLLVGAPMTTGVAREEGRVHVFINQGEADLVDVGFQLTGSDSYASRFGETIVSLGDIDDDGYADVAIGAPQEEELRGALYIYNGRKDGISRTFSQRITGSVLGHDLMMFGQSVSTGVDIDGNGYQDVAVGAFLSDSAVILRTRPVVKIQAFLLLPDSINRTVAQCQEHGAPAVCVNVSVCFRVTSRQYRGHIDIQYNLTSDLHHKPAFPNRFYFHGNGTSNNTMGRVRARHDQVTCSVHQAFMRRDLRDFFTAVYFEVSYALREQRVHRSSTTAFQPLKPIIQQTGQSANTVANKTEFARYCGLVNCSTNLQLSAQLVLPQDLPYFALGNGKTIMLNTSVVNSGDDTFLPRLSLRFPNNIQFIKVLNNEDGRLNCERMEEDNSTTVGVDCSVSSLYLLSQTRLNVSFLLDVNQGSTAGDVTIAINTSGDNYESDIYLHDNTALLVLPLRYAVDLSVHGFVRPSSLVFGDSDVTPVDCYSEKFNFTYKVLNVGPSQALETVVEVDLPKTLTPHPYRLMYISDWQTSHGSCYISNSSIPAEADCNVPRPSFIQEIVFFTSKTSTRRMFCAHGDALCERLVCRLGNLDQGKEATIQLEVKLNPAVLQQAPGIHGIMLLESSAVITSPKADANTVLIQPSAIAKVELEAHFNQKPSPAIEIFFISMSLIVGLLILLALVYCLWKAGFFKREFKKKEEDYRRDSWDYVPKNAKRESYT